jgi:FkbM family methyltransferase
MYKVTKDCQIKNLDKIYEKYFGYPSKGYFVEVGAYDGEFVSNTSFLADHGWNGLYIEPIYEFYLKCLKRHQKNEIIVANVSIGLDEGEKTIYKGETLTTLDENQMNIYKEIDWAQHISFSEEICDQMRLDNLMKKLEVPKNFDLLVVDVEGKEHEVFQTFDLNIWKPKMMIVEIEDEHRSFQKYEKFIKNAKKLRNTIAKNNYTEIYRDEINTIFIMNDFVK